jgi:Leucine-rich repeat (LRR) protein
MLSSFFLPNSSFMKPRLLLLLACFITGALPARAAVNFRTQIWPLLAKSCIDCHRAPHKDPAGKLVEPKGRLRLDGAALIMKGGADGEAVTPRDPDKSTIYARILLPPDHEDVMPPKGKGKALSFDESELSKQWIIEGANFGDWVGAADAGGATAAVKKPTKGADPLATGAGPAPAAAQDAIRRLGALVTPVSTGSPLLRVEWVSGASLVTDKEVTALTSIGSNISELDLSDTKITDEALATLSKFPRLTWLNLNSTAVTDAGIAHLKGLTHLTSLNLHSTNISDTALPSLAPLRKLRQVFLWKTRVTPAEATKFAKSIPDLKITLD